MMNPNLRMQRDVYNYNRRLKRLEEKGYKNLPERQRLRDLQSRISSPSALAREVRRLNKFNVQALRSQTERTSGIEAPKWQFDYLKSNQRLAKAYFEQEYERIDKRVGRFPGERTRLDTISAQINLLSKDLSTMSQSEFRSAISTINQYTASPMKRKSQYRSFLNEVEWVMDLLGYSDEEKNTFFKKFEKLSPNQFLYAYDNYDIINRIFTLYHKDYNQAEAYLTTSEDDAREYMNELLGQVDVIVKDAQANSD